jgi:hypothetical protein
LRRLKRFETSKIAQKILQPSKALPFPQQNDADHPRDP